MSLFARVGDVVLDYCWKSGDKLFRLSAASFVVGDDARESEGSVLVLGPSEAFHEMRMLFRNGEMVSSPSDAENGTSVVCYAELEGGGVGWLPNGKAEVRKVCIDADGEERF